MKAFNQNLPLAELGLQEEILSQVAIPLETVLQLPNFAHALDKERTRTSDSFRYIGLHEKVLETLLEQCFGEKLAPENVVDNMFNLPFNADSQRVG